MLPAAGDAGASVRSGEGRWEWRDRKEVRGAGRTGRERKPGGREGYSKGLKLWKDLSLWSKPLSLNLGTDSWNLEPSKNAEF